MDAAIKSSFYWSFLENFGSMGIQFIGLIVLSRFLSPEDYGLMGIIAIFIAVSNMFVDSGMGASLVKKDQVTVLDYSTLFWYNIAVSLFLYLLIFVFSDSIANFYKIRELSLFIRIIGLTIIVNSISVVQNIRFIRSLKFKHLAVVGVLSNIFSVLIAIILAIQGFGVWALIVQQLIYSVIKSIGLMFISHFKPVLHFSVTSFKEQFSFGFHLLLSNLLKTVYDNIYSSAIGKIANPVFTGYYVQANKLQMIPVNLATSIVDRAMFPILSRIEDSEAFKLTAVSLSNKVLLIAAPALLMVSVSSSYVIDILLGNKWCDAAWILSILCFVGIFMCIQSLNRNILKSLGMTKQIFQIEVLKVGIGLCILAISLFLNYTYIIWGIFLSSVVTCMISGFVVSLKMKYPMKEQAYDILRSVFPSVLAFLALYILHDYIMLPSILGLTVNVILYVSFFVISAFVLNLSEAKNLILYCCNLCFHGIKKNNFFN